MLTCETVLSGVFFLVDLPPDFSYGKHSTEILRNLERYENVPMSFADACLVRLSELHRDSLIFTTDRDFLTYRKGIAAKQFRSSVPF